MKARAPAQQPSRLGSCPVAARPAQAAGARDRSSLALLTTRSGHRGPSHRPKVVCYSQAGDTTTARALEGGRARDISNCSEIETVAGKSVHLCQGGRRRLLAQVDVFLKHLAIQRECCSDPASTQKIKHFLRQLSEYRLAHLRRASPWFAARTRPVQKGMELAVSMATAEQLENSEKARANNATRRD